MADGGAWRRPFLRGLLALGIAALGLGVLFLALARNGVVVRVPNAGMAPVIARGDWVWIDVSAYRKAAPARGEVVCFRGEGLPTLVHAHEKQVKRVVGLPGETISIRDGRVYVGERPAPELAGFRYEVFMYDNYLTNETPSYTVPPDTFFVLGDNPLGSYDSRFFGPVPAASLIGRPVFRLWPPWRWGVMR